MKFFSRAARVGPPFFLAFLLAVSMPLQALAANATAFLTGKVAGTDGAPAAGVQVTASGNNATVRTTTDSSGRFAFPPLAVGSYTVTSGSGSLQATAEVDLGTNGANLALVLAPPEIGRTITSVRQVPAEVIRGSGSDVVLNSTALTQLPFNNSFTEMEVQMPGAVRGANGVVHINGDHGVINYIIDGVALPQELNRDIGGEINLNDLSFVNLIEGAYPAQYGLRFGSVFNMATKAGTGPAGFTGYGTFGSYTTAQGQVGYHAPIGGRGGYDLALSGLNTTRGLDPPNFSSPNNNAASTGQFGRATIPAGKSDFVNVTFINSNSSYQIPNDVDGGEPATTTDVETQADTFLTAQYHHLLGDTGVVTFGPAFKSSRIADFGDPPNDFIYGEALNPGLPTDCANALTDPTVMYTPQTCAYSLFDTRTALDYIFQADYNQRFGKHTIAAGGEWDLTRVLKNYSITLQPGNFLAGLAPYYPNVPVTDPVTVVDNAPNLGNTYQAYVQDSWRTSDLWEVDYGLRYDFFNIKSTEFNQGFGAFSPRLKITRSWGTRASLYAYIGRFFEPFSFENVSPSAAYLLNLPLQPTPAQFDLLPERDTQLELGGHIPLGSGDLGFRVWQKNANNLIDDTQVGTTLLHQDINYVLGRLSQEAINYVQPLPRNGRAYFSAAHVQSHNSGCETQLLAPCFGSPTGYTPADHEQVWSVATGVLLNNKRGGWFSADAEYGSGLSTGLNPTPGITCAGPGYTANIGGPCKFTPHTTINVEDGIALTPSTAITFAIQNLLNDRYFVTYLNAQGNHFAPPRTFQVGFTFK